MLLIGLTGGIACGKTTVAAMMRELGCHVLDADTIAHRIIEPSQPAYDGVVREFGRDILTAGGQVDRAALGKIVFADPIRLARLNTIVHPFVVAELDRQFAQLEHEDPHGIAVVEAALLVESGYYRKLDRLVVVGCQPEQQIERLTNRAGRGMTREQAERRVSVQSSFAEKRRLAHYEIDSSGALDDTRRQVSSLVAELKRLAETRIP